MAKVLHTLEEDSEAFEEDRTSGVVDIEGYLVEVRKKEPHPALPDKLAAGVHPGVRDPAAGPATAKKEKKEQEEGRPRRRRREEKPKSRSRSRRRERKKPKKEPTPEPVKEVETEQEEPIEEAEVEAEVESEEKDEEVNEGSQDDVPSPDTEVARDPEGAGLRKVPPKPSARKPLPRRPRTPSRSPPGYQGYRQDGPKKWKGVKHIIRGQTLGYSSHGRPQKGKGKGKWHRR